MVKTPQTQTDHNEDLTFSFIGFMVYAFILALT